MKSETSSLKRINLISVWNYLPDIFILFLKSNLKNELSLDVGILREQKIFW